MTFKQGLNSNGEPMRDSYVEKAEIFGFECADDGMTRQEFAAECDINTLMARYERTGVLPLRSGEAQYLDLTEMPSDLMGALAVMDAATRAFNALPATVRREFDNDPVQFVDYCSNPDNLPKLAEWGLAAPQKPAHEVSTALEGEVASSSASSSGSSAVPK